MPVLFSKRQSAVAFVTARSYKSLTRLTLAPKTGAQATAGASQEATYICEKGYLLERMNERKYDG